MMNEGETVAVRRWDGRIMIFHHQRQICQNWQKQHIFLPALCRKTKRKYLELEVYLSSSYPALISSETNVMASSRIAIPSFNSLSETLRGGIKRTVS
jgi:hypothetical protein